MVPMGKRICGYGSWVGEDTEEISEGCIVGSSEGLEGMVLLYRKL